jgi:hypothetical protein
MPEDLTDHDLLTTQTAILGSVRDTLNDIKRDNRDDHKIINEKLDRKVNNKLFYFVICIITSCLIGITVYAGKTKNEVTKNTTCIERLEKN